MNNISSPDNSVDGIERLIQSLNCDAPRLSPQILRDNIKHVEYVKHVSHSGQVLRWAILTTQSGFAHTGRPSVSVSQENDRQIVGEQVAYDNAFSELWPLMGYELKQRLYERTQPAQAPEA